MEMEMWEASVEEGCRIREAGWGLCLDKVKREKREGKTQLCSESACSSGWEGVRRAGKMK